MAETCGMRPFRARLFALVLRIGHERGDEEAMALSAKIVETVQPDLVDINFGCPVKKVVSKGAGAGVLKDLPLMTRLTEAVVKEIIASGILPEGALQLICGSAGDLLDHVTAQDVVTFTGSATTGLMLKSNQNNLTGITFFNN